MWRTWAWLCISASWAGEPLDPYPDCDGWTLEGCPGDLAASDWELLSSVPSGSVGTVRPEELELGAGMGADQAWRHTLGRWDVTVAVLDSGIEWRRNSLWSQVLLNEGELPLPQDADGEDASRYDYDGNGVFDINDYLDDPRVDPAAGDAEATSGLDPSDLFAAFADGIDDDGNGYADDIAGWDFFRDDADPGSIAATSYADHGTGVMADAAQGGDDGSGIGVCPNCSILPLRLSDQLLDDGDKVALAIAYAADRGAEVVVMALASLSDPPWMRDAIAWAEAHDVVLVAVAGDENGYHHNNPAWHAGVLMTHSVGPDGADGSASGNQTFLNFINCNNFSPRLDLVVSSGICGTGATSRLGGAAGLVISAGRDVGLELSAAEVRELLRGTVDDVSLSAEDVTAVNTYPSAPGWDGFYGAGRLNLGRAVEDVVAGEIPPTAWLETDWFAWVEGPSFEVQGTVQAPRSEVAGWTLSWGRGAEPETWTELAEGAEAVDGVLGSIDLSGWTSTAFAPLESRTTIEERFARANADLLQLRLVVEDIDGRRAEERRGVWVHDDPWALDGFPVSLGTSGEAPPVLADLDGDQVQEIVLPTAAGQVWVLDGTGAALPGWPVDAEDHPAAALHGLSPFVASVEAMRETFVAGAAVGDVDGDASPDVVAVSTQGTVYAWTNQGELLDGFPTALWERAPEEFVANMAFDDGAYAAPALEDIDGDGAHEIVIAGLDQRLYVFDGDGDLWPGYPLELCHPTLCGVEGARLVHTPALGDVDADGDIDAVVGSAEIPEGYAGTVYLVDLLEAATLPSSPIDRAGLGLVTILPIVGDGHPGSPAIGDVDGDGDLELASIGSLGTELLVHHDGEEYATFVQGSAGFGDEAAMDAASVLPLSTRGVLADVDGDGTLDLAAGGSSLEYLVSLALHVREEFQHGLMVFSGATGEVLPGFPQQVEDIGLLVGPVVADLSGDGLAEVVHTSSGGFVHAFDANGESAPGFPHLTGGWHMGSPAIGDIDGDGYLDVVMVSREGHLFAWTTEGRADVAVPWASWNHDARNTNNAEVVNAPQPGPVVVAQEGCGCGGSGDTAWLLLLLPWWRRRRR